MKKPMEKHPIPIARRNKASVGKNEYIISHIMIAPITSLHYTT